MLARDRLQPQALTVPEEAPASGQCQAARPLAQRQPAPQGFKAPGPQPHPGAALQPEIEQPLLTAGGELAQPLAVQSWSQLRLACSRGGSRRLQGREGQQGQLLGEALAGFQTFGRGAQTTPGPGMELLEHRQHLLAQPVAAEAEIGVTGIQPQGQVLLLTEGCGLGSGEAEQGTHQLDGAAEGTACAQAAQSPQPATPGQVEQQGLRPVTAGMASHDAGAVQAQGLPEQPLVAPAAPSLLMAGGGGGWPSGGVLHPHRQAQAAGPGRQLSGLIGGFLSPAVVAVPEVQLPVVQASQLQQQGRQGHRVLATGDGQQQAAPPGQELGVRQQSPVQPVLQGTPWENRCHLPCSPMSRLTSLPAPLQAALHSRRLLKVIAGLRNFEAASVERISRAAGAGGADLLDVACDPDLVRLAAAASGLPVCVSAVDPELFPAAVAAGAAMVEIGNFDSFYPEGRIFGAEEVLALTRRTRELLPEVVLSVTVPHGLPLDQQQQLASDLAAAGADLIQTEGGTSARPFSPGVLGLIEKAAPTLAAAHAISRAVELPVLCASGLSAVTLPMAIAAGAHGVGVGSAVNRLDDELAMVAVVRGLRESLAPARVSVS